MKKINLSEDTIVKIVRVLIIVSMVIIYLIQGWLEVHWV